MTTKILFAILNTVHYTIFWYLSMPMILGNVVFRALRALQASSFTEAEAVLPRNSIFGQNQFTVHDIPLTLCTD